MSALLVVAALDEAGWQPPTTKRTSIPQMRRSVLLISPSNSNTRDFGPHIQSPRLAARPILRSDRRSPRFLGRTVPGVVQALGGQDHSGGCHDTCPFPA